MSKPQHSLQIHESKPNISSTFHLTESSRKEYIELVAKLKNKPSIPVKVAFIPNAEERQIIEAAQGKHGINKATDILRMALRRFAEVEGLRAS